MEKPIMYDPIPKFEQGKQAVIQLDPADMGDYVLVKNKVIDLPNAIEVDDTQETVRIGEEVYLRPVELPIYERVNNLEKENAQLKVELAEIKKAPTVKAELVTKEPIIKEPIKR